jgi:transposase InsO family protein
MKIGQVEKRSVNTLCSLLGYSRQSFYQYRQQKEEEALQADLLLQEVIFIRTAQKRLGARKLFFVMQGFIKEHSIQIGRDAFFDLLRNNNLLVRKRKLQKPITTFSNHWMRKYDNLIVGFIPTAPNQVYVSDITYITLKEKYAYLSLVTDTYSRKIVGFYLSKNLSADGCIQALEMAIANASSDILVHHSDRGTQYCCLDYVALLTKNKINISMTQSGDPLENALAERVNGILKDELLEGQYLDFDQAKEAVALAVSIYNHQRPHSSINMLTPVVAYLGKGELKKHWKNYYTYNKGKEENAMC